MIQAVLIFNNHGKPRLSKFYTPLTPSVQQSLLTQIFSLVSDRSNGLCNFLDAPDLKFPRAATGAAALLGGTAGSSTPTSRSANGAGTKYGSGVIRGGTRTGTRRRDEEVVKKKGERSSKGNGKKVIAAEGYDEIDGDGDGDGDGSIGDVSIKVESEQAMEEGQEGENDDEADDDDNDEDEQEDAEDELRVIYRHYATLYFVFVVDGADSELGILDLIQVFVESLDRSFENVCELDLIFHFDEVLVVLSEIIQGGLVLETNINEIASSVHQAAAQRKASSALPASGIIPGNISNFASNLATNVSQAAAGRGGRVGFSRGFNSGSLTGRWLQGLGVGN